MRIIELDLHRTFAEVAVLKDGVISREGRVEITHQHIDAFAAKLQADDEVVLEATGNAIAVAERLRPHVGRVIVANAREVRLIAQAKIKTDKIDTAVLAQLHASGFLPEVWIPDAPTKVLRRPVAGFYAAVDTRSPASEGILVPWNSSFRRRSKSTLE